MKDDAVYDEIACDTQSDIGVVCREMLRWVNKLGYDSKYASKSRERNNGFSGNLKGKIWNIHELDEER